MNEELTYTFLDQYDVFNLYDADSINNLTQHLQNYPDYKWALIHKDSFDIPVLEMILRNAATVNIVKIDYWLNKKPGLINSIHSFYGNFISSKNALQEETMLGLLTLELSKEKYIDLFIRYFPIIMLKLGTLDDNSFETINEFIEEIGWEDTERKKYIPLFLPFENNQLDLETILEVIDPNDKFDEDKEPEEEVSDPQPYYPNLAEIMTNVLKNYNYENILKGISSNQKSLEERLTSIEEKLNTNNIPDIDHEEITELNNQLESYIKEVEELNTELSEKDVLIKELQDTIQELNSNLPQEDTTAQVGVLQDEITNLRTELDTRMETESQLRQEIDSLKLQINNNTSDINTEELLKENNELKEAIKKINYEKNKLSTENTLLKDAVNNRKINNENFAPPIVEKVDETANNNLAGIVLRENNNTPTIDENDENIKRLNRFFKNF